MFPSDTKILIVDDSSFARTMVKKCLKELKFWKILEAVDAKEAQNLLQEKEQATDPVHLVICDIHMPTMSGIELVRWMRTQEQLKTLPVIILTSSQDKQQVLEVGKLGVSHFMIKPFDEKMLGEKLVSTWQKHGQTYVQTHPRSS